MQIQITFPLVRRLAFETSRVAAIWALCRFAWGLGDTFWSSLSYVGWQGLGVWASGELVKRWGQHLRKTSATAVAEWLAYRGNLVALYFWGVLAGSRTAERNAHAFGWEIFGSLLVAGLLVMALELNGWLKLKRAQQAAAEAFTEEPLTEQPRSAQPPPDESAFHRQVLGVSPEATPEEIKQAWRAILKDCHPDRLSAAPDSVKAAASRLSVQANIAYDYLSRKQSASSLNPSEVAR